MNIVILAAGQGKRMRSALPKVLQTLAGRPLLAHVIESARAFAKELHSPAHIIVVIGHGAPWLEREGLIAHFREALPGVPIVALLRHNDDSFSDADFNCPADNPPLWERTVIQALLKTDKLQ